MLTRSTRGIHPRRDLTIRHLDRERRSVRFPSRSSGPSRRDCGVASEDRFVLTRSTLATYPRSTKIHTPQGRCRSNGLRLSGPPGAAPRTSNGRQRPSAARQRRRRVRCSRLLGAGAAIPAPRRNSRRCIFPLRDDCPLRDCVSCESAAPPDSHHRALHNPNAILAWPVRIASCSPRLLSRPIRAAESSISSESAASSDSPDPRRRYAVGIVAWPVRIASCPPGPLSRPIRAPSTSGTYKNGCAPNGLAAHPRSPPPQPHGRGKRSPRMATHRRARWRASSGAAACWAAGSRSRQHAASHEGATSL